MSDRAEPRQANVSAEEAQDKAVKSGGSMDLPGFSIVA